MRGDEIEERVHISRVAASFFPVALLVGHPPSPTLLPVGAGVAIVNGHRGCKLSSQLRLMFYPQILSSTVTTEIRHTDPFRTHAALLLFAVGTHWRASHEVQSIPTWVWPHCRHGGRATLSSGLSSSTKHAALAVSPRIPTSPRCPFWLPSVSNGSGPKVSETRKWVRGRSMEQEPAIKTANSLVGAFRSCGGDEGSRKTWHWAKATWARM